MRLIAKALFLFALFNLLLFVLTDFYLGGTALSGFYKDGHYFVGEKRHFTEATKAAFLFSRYQNISVFITTPLGLIFGVFLELQVSGRSLGELILDALRGRA